MKITKENQLILIKIISNLFQNLGAGWFGLALITPNFTGLFDIHTILILISDLAFGIMFLVVAFFIEKIIITYER